MITKIQDYGDLTGRRHPPDEPVVLYRKAFPASAGATGVGITEIKAFTIEAIAEVECGIDEVQKTFQIGHYLDAVILKDLVSGLLLIIKIEFVAQPGAPSPDHTDPQKISRIAGNTGLRHKFVHFGFGLLTDANGVIG